MTALRGQLSKTLIGEVENVIVLNGIVEVYNSTDKGGRARRIIRIGSILLGLVRENRWK